MPVLRRVRLLMVRLLCVFSLCLTVLCGVVLAAAADGKTLRMAYDAEKLIPVFPSPIILPSPRPTKGAFARRCRSGTGRGARGARFATSHSGGTGAPPGSNTRPCQELAEVVDLALPAFGLLERGIKD